MLLQTLALLDSDAAAQILPLLRGPSLALASWAALLDRALSMSER